LAYDASTKAGEAPTDGKQYVRRNAAWEAAVAPSTLAAINAQTTTAYTLVLADKVRYVRVSNTAANTVTIPTNASVAFAIGTQITVRQSGAGKTTIAGGYWRNRELRGHACSASAAFHRLPAESGRGRMGFGRRRSMMNFALGVIAGSLRKVGATSGGGAFVNDANTVALLHFDETPFVDAAGKAFIFGSAVTRVADAAAVGGYQANFPSGASSVAYINNITPLNPNASYTVEFYLQTTATSGNLVYMYENNNGNRIYFYIYQNKILWSVTSYTDISTNQTVNDGVRRHYRFVYDSSTKIGYIFVNGALEKTINQTGVFPAGYPTNIYIGTTGSTTGSFVGKLDELRISTVARSTTSFTPP
jgi:hypothetical protein